MSTQIAGSNGMTGTSVIQPTMVRKALLVCGLLSSLLYVGMDIFASIQWDGYSYVSQVYSELTAVEAPTRSLMVFGSAIPYSLLVLAFAAGVWVSAGRKRALRIVAALLIAYTVAGIIGGIIFPMHSRGESAMTLTDIMPIIATIAGVLSMLLSIGFGAASFGKRFRLYSIGTILLLVLGGVLSSLDSSRLAEGLPTPRMGVTERINIYAFMGWVLVLAIILLRAEKDQNSHPVSAEINSKRKTALTLGGIGPRLALMCLPYVVLSFIVMLRDPGFFDLGFLDFLLAKVMGFIWLGLGLIFWISSAITFLRYFPAGKLITRGPFALCRNPIYSSLIVFVVPSLALLFHSGLVFSISLVLFIGFKISIHGETIVLRRTFGAEYEIYEKSVNEIFPFPRLRRGFAVSSRQER